MSQRMTRPSTTQLSSRGQVVIPKEVREELGLEPGTPFTVTGSGDTIVLKRVKRMTPQEFRAAIEANRAWADKEGITPADLERAIREVRAEMRAEREAAEGSGPQGA